MLEEKTKWQQPLQNKKVGGNKFFLFSRTNMAATRLYIKPCFIFVLFSSPLTNLFSWILFLFELLFGLFNGVRSLVIVSNGLSSYWA
jgi:ABC-type protease/lipase transport system fused ATPase/permease subunit